MVTTIADTNGSAELAEAPPAAPELPELIHLMAGEARRIPSPGAQRALKAETGRSYDELCGPDAESADRFQTLIWLKLRRDHPGLSWAACEDVGVQVEEGVVPVDPSQLAASASSPPSAGSGD